MTKKSVCTIAIYSIVLIAFLCFLVTRYNPTETVKASTSYEQQKTIEKEDEEEIIIGNLMYRVDKNTNTIICYCTPKRVNVIRKNQDRYFVSYDE